MNDETATFYDAGPPGCGDYPAYLGTRGLDELRQHGKPMRLEILHKGDEMDWKECF